MNEYTIGYTFIGGLVGFAIGALLYMMGGRHNKALRRYLAPAVITVTMVICSLILKVFTWKLLAIYPFMVLQFIQGYSNNNGFGWVKRIGVSVTALMLGAYLSWVFGNYWLLIPHALCAFSTVLFAFKNPMYASGEEPFVMTLNNLPILAYIFIIP